MRTLAAAALVFFTARAWWRLMRQTNRMRDNAARLRADIDFWNHAREQMKADHE